MRKPMPGKDGIRWRTSLHELASSTLANTLDHYMGHCSHLQEMASTILTLAKKRLSRLSEMAPNLCILHDWQYE